MRKLVVFIGIIIIAGIAAFRYIAIRPLGLPKVGPPIVVLEAPKSPLFIFIPVKNIGKPVSNLGFGTLQLSMSIWGSFADITSGSINGLEKYKADKDTRGSGLILVRSQGTYFISPSDQYRPDFDKYLLGEITQKRKYPVHVSYGWRRDELHGEEWFIIPPNKNVAVQVPARY